MPYIIKFPHVINPLKSKRFNTGSRTVDVYLVLAEPKNIVTQKLTEATRFETIFEASRYHVKNGFGTRRGQITKVEE